MAGEVTCKLVCHAGLASGVVLEPILEGQTGLHKLLFLHTWCVHSVTLGSWKTKTSKVCYGRFTWILSVWWMPNTGRPLTWPALKEEPGRKPCSWVDGSGAVCK